MAGFKSPRWAIANELPAGALTVAGAPAVAFTVDVDPDRLLTNAGGMALTPDPATGRLTGTSVGLVITGQTYTAYGTPATLTSTVNGTLRHGFAYTPDAMGRIATITETGETPRVTTYAYDSAGRLWQVWRDGTQVAQYEHLGTDGANGNRTAWSAGGHTFTASYDGQDRLTGYTDDGTATTLGYDAHGNVQTRTTDADVTTYTWDPRGPLVGVQRPGGAALIEYVLDPAGRRIGRKVGGALERGWLYAGGLLPVAETDADGHTVRRVFVYATRPNVPDLVQQLEGASWVTYRVLVDHLGSVRSVVRASDGALVQRMDYDAFGVVLDDWSASGWVRIPFGFAGGLYDRETGLVRFGAREYDARVGRWVSRDPALFGGGDSNLYRYCGGEPVNFIDVDGEVALPVVLLLVGVASVWAGWDLGAYIYERTDSSQSVSAERADRILRDAENEAIAQGLGPAGDVGVHSVLLQWRRSGNGFRGCSVPLGGPDDIDLVAAEHRATHRVHVGRYGRGTAEDLATVYDAIKMSLGPLPYLPGIGSRLLPIISSDGRPPTMINRSVTRYATSYSDHASQN